MNDEGVKDLVRRYGFSDWANCLAKREGRWHHHAAVVNCSALGCSTRGDTGKTLNFRECLLTDLSWMVFGGRRSVTKAPSDSRGSGFCSAVRICPECPPFAKYAKDGPPAGLRNAEVRHVVDDVFHTLVIVRDANHSHAHVTAMSDGVAEANYAVDRVLVFVNKVALQIDPPIGVKTAQQFDNVLGVCGSKSAEPSVHVALNRDVRVRPNMLKSNLYHRLF